jgi:hypothetical protein
MAGSLALLDLPLEILTGVCQQLDLHDPIAVAKTCKHFCRGDGGRRETAELPTKSPVVTALCVCAFPRFELVPGTRPACCSESWVAYLVRCARQRRCREAPPIAVSSQHGRFVDAAGRLLACGKGVAAGHKSYRLPTPVAVMAG